MRRPYLRRPRGVNLDNSQELELFPGKDWPDDVNAPVDPSEQWSRPGTQITSAHYPTKVDPPCIFLNPSGQLRGATAVGKPARTPPHFERFRRLVRRVGVPARHAEDLAQEALLRDWEARGRLEPGVDPAPYSVTIALNLARSHLRDASRRGEVLTSFDEHDFRGDQASPEALLRRQEREAVMRDLIEQVDPKYRDLLVEHEIEEKSLAEIAAELGLKLDTVRSQHRRAREQLDEAKRRWMAQQEFRGWDKVPCVPVAFGLFRRSWWTTALQLQKVGVKVFAQAALVVLTGAVVATAPRSSGSASTTPWLRPAAIGTPERPRPRSSTPRRPSTSQTHAARSPRPRPRCRAASRHPARMHRPQ